MRLFKTDILYCLLWTILSFLIVFFFEVAISPRYNLYYGDCTVFKTIAQAWIDGIIPYKDLFDHKGPYQYLINVVGLSISDRWGLFLMSGINLSIVSVVLWFTSNLFLRRKLSALCVGIFLGCFVCVNNGGNMTETWCLPFSVIPLYLFCKSIIRNSCKWWYNIIYGFCFGVIAFIRINNGIIPAVIILVLFINLIWQKRFWPAAKQIGIQLLGFIAAILPIAIYFNYKGALDDMLYANYVFNVEYMLKWGSIAGAKQIPIATRILKNLQWLFPVILLFIWSIRDFLLKRSCRDISLMLSVASGVTILANIRGMNYLHYYISFLPLVVVLSVKVFKSWGECKTTRQWIPKSLTALFVLWSVCLFLPTLFSWGIQLCKDVCKFGILHSSESNTEVDVIEKMIECNIPDIQSGTIYNVGIYEGAAALLKMKSVPAGKYFFLQSELYKVSERVECEINEYHHNSKPIYILTDKENMYSGCETFKMMLEDYQVVDSTDNSIYLLKIKSTNYE